MKKEQNKKGESAKKPFENMLEQMKYDSKVANNVFFLILILILVLPWLLLIVIKAINVILYENIAFFNLGEDGISTWFAFWGGYIGTIVTYVLTAFTVRLNFTSEKQAEKDGLEQLALQLDQLEIEKVCFCDLEQNYPIRELELFEESVGYKYLIKVIFTEPFPVYFRLDDQKKLAFGEEKIAYDTGNLVLSCHTNGKALEILFLISENSKLLNDIEKFYYINYYEQSVMSVKKRIKHLSFTFQFENTLYSKKIYDKSRYKMSVDIKLENKDTYQKQWIELTVLDRVIEGKKEN